MELHTLGVGSGYTQEDVQELARILTGMGVNLSGQPRRLQCRRLARLSPRRSGLFEFNPNRHDFGDKNFLGTTIKGGGIERSRTRPSTILSRRAAHRALYLPRAGGIFLLRRPARPAGQCHGRDLETQRRRHRRRCCARCSPRRNSRPSLGTEVQGPDPLCRVGACAPPMASR